MVAAILSPHFDDAVLSCWHLLEQPGDVIVINVFAGEPANGSALPWWDQLTGATDPEQRVRERIAEDREALASIGRKPVNLGFLDEQYRESEQPVAPLVAEIEHRLDAGAHIFAPAALGDHADHALVRAAALELRTTGVQVSLYADLPHATLHGWPTWVTGRETGAVPDLAAALWDRTLTRTGVAPATMRRVVHELDQASHARKLTAVRRYETQLQGLIEFAGRPLMDRETLGYEVVWNLPIAATRSRDPECRRVTRRP